jgi:flavin-dependent dehydrogenase
MERRPLVIIGSGPAGTATALFLQAQDRRLAGEVVVLEKARHPRVKVCAGGLIPHTLDCLRELDIPLSVPNVSVCGAQVTVPGRSVAYRGPELCRVVRRDEFDHALVVACRERGIEVREGEKVSSLTRQPDGIRIQTERGAYLARAVVGADGSGSLVRRQLVAAAGTHVGKAVMCDVPVGSVDWRGFAERRYDFSFAAVPQGLRGYLWAFPCLVGGVPHVNVGAYSVGAAGVGKRLHALLDAELTRLQAPGVARQSFPIRWYARGTAVAAPHVMLAGDAAGVDPLMGEGISFAFEYGRRAAAAALRAIATQDFTFADYAAAVHTSWMGRKLRRLNLATRLFYGRSWRLWFAVAARSERAREIGLRWYNGVDGWDRRSGWEALRAWRRGVAPPAMERT